MKKTVLCAFLCFAAVAAHANERGYGYQADVDRSAYMDEAARIMRETGGYFTGPREISAVAETARFSQSVVPFTARELYDCARPCALVNTVSSFGARAVESTIAEMLRSPEFRGRIDSRDSRLTGWFLSEQFSNKVLRSGWHLLPLRPRDRGASFDRAFRTSREQPFDAVTAVWVLALLPPDAFSGTLFYTSDKTHDGDAVVVGRGSGGELIIDRRLSAIGDPQVGHLFGISRLSADGAREYAPPAEGPRKRRLREKVEGR